MARDERVYSVENASRISRIAIICSHGVDPEVTVPRSSQISAVKLVDESGVANRKAIVRIKPRSMSRDEESPRSKNTPDMRTFVIVVWAGAAVICDLARPPIQSTFVRLARWNEIRILLPDEESLIVNWVYTARNCEVPRKPIG